MKGFMHVVEIILVVILVFFVFTQFSYIPRISTDWSAAKLYLTGNDVLHVLEEKNVNWFDYGEVKSILDATLPENIKYSVETTGSIKPEITVACVKCDLTMMDRLDRILDSGMTMINNRTIKFDVVGVDDLSEAFALDFDVALFFSYEDLSPYERELRNFIASKKGVVEIFDVTDSSMTDPIQQGIFGIGWDASKSQNSDPVTFTYESTDSNNAIHEAYKWATHTPIFYDSFENLGKWYFQGTPSIGYAGDTPPSVILPSGGCSSGSRITSGSYDSFRDGEIDADVFLQPNGIAFIEFRIDPSLSEYYVARISSGGSMTEPDAFLKMDGGLTEIGSNVGHSTVSGTFHRIKIVVDGPDFRLYNDGELVAEAFDNSFTSGSIGFSSLCADADIDNARVTLRGDQEFGNFLGSQEHVVQAIGENRKVLLEQDSGLKAAILNDGSASGSGRAVWISGIPDGELTSEKMALLKSLIMWAAGDAHKIVSQEIRNPTTALLYRTYNKDMLEIVTIRLDLGYLY